MKHYGGEKLKPVLVSDLELTFGGNIAKLLPSIDSIPKEFKDGKSKWNKVINDWFYCGLKKCKWNPKEGVNPKDAIRHVGSVLSSFEPKHEHKMAGCAFLLSEFFNDVQYEINKKGQH